MVLHRHLISTYLQSHGYPIFTSCQNPIYTIECIEIKFILFISLLVQPVRSVHQYSFRLTTRKIPGP